MQRSRTFEENQLKKKHTQSYGFYAHTQTHTELKNDGNINSSNNNRNKNNNKQINTSFGYF